MKDEQTKAAIVQWLVPGIVLVIVVIVMLFNFSVKSRESAAAEVENNVVDIVDKYATKLNHELVRMSDAGKPIARLLEKNADQNLPYAAGLAATLYENSRAYAVVFIDSSGRGIDHESNRVNLSNAAYFEGLILKEEAAVDTPEVQNIAESKNPDDAVPVEEVKIMPITPTEGMSIRYFYAQDDELGLGKEAVIAVISTEADESSNMLLMYFPLEEMKNLFRKNEFDADAFYALVDADGNIFESAGSDSHFLSGTNIWEDLQQNSEYTSSVSRAVVRMKNRTPGSFSAIVNNEARKLVYAPVGINNWSLVAGINQKYIDSIQDREWNNTKQMIYQLLAALFVFLALVVVINIIYRIKSSEKSKELEEKADTDLLTGLNNKLATERKIKEYMENHPNELAMMFVLDIDNFKKINDTLGHAFGDEVLRSLGHQIGAVFRATDVIGRTGGDEFTIFLKHLNDCTLLDKEAGKLCQFFHNFQAGEYVKYAATASIGAAVYPRDGKDFESLYKAADTALYKAKKRGKNQLAFYGEDSKKV